MDMLKLRLEGQEFLADVTKKEKQRKNDGLVNVEIKDFRLLKANVSVDYLDIFITSSTSTKDNLS